MADVVHVAHPDGSHSIGLDLDGTFVAFVTLDAAHVDDAVERARELHRRAATGDEEAVKVVGPQAAPAPEPAPAEPAPAPPVTPDVGDTGEA